MSFTGIIGHPLTHTLSPLMHRTAFRKLGMDAQFEIWDTSADYLTSRVEKLREPSCLGACVTVPYKEIIIPFLDIVDEKAREIGAVNWIANKDGRLIGHNTDGLGFLASLKDIKKVVLSGKRVVLIGAGGAARSIVWAARHARADSLTIGNRTFPRAEQIRLDFEQERFPISVFELNSPDFVNAVRQADLVVNSTSVGMSSGPDPGGLPIPIDAITSRPLACDIVYSPRETLFLRLFTQAGADTLGGLPMLVLQGAIGFEIISGRVAPKQEMAISVGCTL